MVVVNIYEKGNLYATARIWNDETGTKEYANYEAEMETLRKYKHTANVVGFAKDPGSPWALLYTAIKNSYWELGSLPSNNIEVCKVVIALWPRGNQRKSRVLGIMEVQRARQGEEGLCDFDVFMQTFHEGTTYKRNAKITDFELSNSNPWILVAAAIETAIRGTKYLP